MKSRTLTCVTGMMLFIALTTPGPAIPVPDASAPIATGSPTREAKAEEKKEGQVENAARKEALGELRVTDLRMVSPNCTK
jgi:hypothetical protein